MKVVQTVSADKGLEHFFDSTEDRREFKKYTHERRLVSRLAAVRASRGVTQAKIADEMGCRQAKISKLESGVDADVTISALEAYARATNSEIAILISDRGKGLAEQVKYHAVSIRRAFLELVELAHKDDLIAQGIAKLHVEAFQNINSFLQETAEKLPRSANGQPYVQVVSESHTTEESANVISQGGSIQEPRKKKSSPREDRLTSGR